MSFEDTEQQTLVQAAIAAKTEFKLNVTVPEGRVITISDGVRTKTYTAIPAGKRIQLNLSATLEDVPV